MINYHSSRLPPVASKTRQPLVERTTRRFQRVFDTKTTTPPKMYFERRVLPISSLSAREDGPYTTTAPTKPFQTLLQCHRQ